MSHPIIIIISDLHLGSPKGIEKAESLLPIISLASTLIVNGDCAELHVEPYRNAAAEELEKLRSLCHKCDTKLILLAGNHDPHITSDRYIIHEKSGVFITHGDVITDSVCPWSDSASIMRKRHQEITAAQSQERRNSIDGAFEACHEGAISEWDSSQNAGTPSTIFKLLMQPRQCWEVMRFWKNHASLMVDFCERFVPSAQLILVGHSHRPSVRKVRGRVFVNTGCYGFPGHPQAAIFDEHGFRVQRIVSTDGEWNLESQAIYQNAEFIFDEHCLHNATIGPIQSNETAEETSAESTPVHHPEASQ